MELVKKTIDKNGKRRVAAYLQMSVAKHCIEISIGQPTQFHLKVSSLGPVIVTTPKC